MTRPDHGLILYTADARPQVWRAPVSESGERPRNRLRLGYARRQPR